MTRHNSRGHHAASAGDDALAWRKSSYSAGTGGQCVEVARSHGATAMRDSKNPTGPRLAFASYAFDAFVQTVKIGTFDLHRML